MSLIELTKDRFSVRKFTAEPVSDGDLMTILGVAANAPTGCNLQPQHLYVVKSPEALEKVRKCTKCHFDAPMIIAVTYDEEASWQRPFDGKHYGEVDATIVATQMMLAIEELGLGTCMVAFFEPEKLQAALELPQGRVPLLLLPVGHPAPDAEPSPRHGDRKPLSETVSML